MMKNVMSLALSSLALSVPVAAMAQPARSQEKTYVCTDADGNQADLTVNVGGDSGKVYWSEPWHSAESNGDFVGKEEAPYSSRKGYSNFRLTDFFSTDDSSYILAINKVPAGKLTAVVYFDNDDHDEEVTPYTCVVAR